MEKLINLLNEYEAKRHKTGIVANIWGLKDDRLSYLEMNTHYSELLCISKGYLFIDWLLKEKKISLLRLTCMNPKYTAILDSDFSREDEIIMILSIQDEPIEFLISILE